MTIATQAGGADSGGGYLDRSGGGGGGGLADVVELILDKGLVLDAFVSVSLVGIEILTINARVVIASVDTYLRFAEAAGRLNLEDKTGKDLSEMVSDTTQGGARGKTGGAIEGVKNALGSGDEKKSESARSGSRQGSGHRRG